MCGEMTREESAGEEDRGRGVTWEYTQRMHHTGPFPREARTQMSEIVTTGEDTCVRGGGAIGVYAL